ncbi:MAG: 50S ribosomal protein L30 [Chloroflexi bacterium]|nr:50S ribosomal protein L30 [Chloroflexota bacterium]
MAGTLRITYVKSTIGYSRRQKDTVRSLGFKRLGQTIEVPDNPAIRGMVHRVQHLVVIDEEIGPEGESVAATETALAGAATGES